MTLKFRVLEVVKIHVRAKMQQAKCSGLCVINSALDLDNCRPWSRISLERIKQSTSRKRRYQLRFIHVGWKQL